MDDKKGLPWLLLLMMFSGLGLAVAAPPSPKPAPPPSAEAPKKADGANQPAPGFSECRARVEELQAAGYEAEVVIATVPDPLDSLYPRLFDLFSAAIRRATEGEGYSEDLSCLPWSLADAKASPGKDSPSYRREPGWLLFRRHDAGSTDPTQPRHPGLLAVLLVGESPPRGVQSAALTAALDEAVRLQGGWATPQVLRLLAPTFSSSTVSLASTLKSWAGKLPDAGEAVSLRILSGTTTASGLDTVARRVIGQHPRLTLSIGSLATPDAKLRDALFETFLPEQFGYTLRASEESPPKVALLVESSLYGQGFSESQTASALIVPFPVHISTLRSEYEKEGGNKPKALDISQDTGGLSLAAGADAQARDALRVFDVTGTSRTQDLELAHQLAYIARERIPFVGIVATNIRDTLFLAGLLKKQVPDVRLFTFEGDVLLSHPSFASATRGMLVISSHSLEEPAPFERGRARTARTSPTAQTLLRFGSDATHGVYRGLLTLLRNDAAGREIWISAVGRHGLYPLRRLEVDPSPALAEAATRGLSLRQQLMALPPIPPPPRGWTLLLLGFTAVAVGMTVYLLAKRRARRGASAPATDRRQTLLFLLISLAVLLPCSVAAGPALGSNQGWGLVTIATSLDLLLLVVVSASFLLQLADQTRRAKAEGNRSEARKSGWWALHRELALGLGAVALYGAMMVYNLWLLSTDPASVPLFLERMIRFGSGLSPFLPTLLLIGVVLAWLLLALRRLQGSESLPELEETRGAGQQALSRRLWAALREARWALGPGGHHRLGAHRSRRLQERQWTMRLTVWGLGWAVPLIYLASYYNQGASRLQPPLRSLEHWGFSWEASLFFALALACSLEAGLALWRGWRSLQRMVLELQDLELGPELATGQEGATKLPGWMAEVEAAAKPAIDATERLAEQRDAAWEALKDELAQTPLDGSFPAGELDELRKALPAPSEKPTASELAQLWLAVVGWARLRQRVHAAPSEAERPLLRRGASFLAWQTAHLTGELSSRLIDLMRFLTLSLLATLIAMSVYPFEPERVITFYVGSLIAAAILISLAFVFQAEKNPMLSHLAGTEAGRITWHRSLLQKLGLYAVVPLLTLLTRQIPQLQQLLGALLEPLSKVFS